jgi:hypothetical protein
MAITTNEPMTWARDLRKNPFLSAWLGAADVMAGVGRGLWLAELHRQQAAMLAELGRQTLRFWSTAWLPQPAPRPTPPAVSVAEARTVLAEPDREAKRDASGDGQAQPETPAERPAAQLRATEVRRMPSPGPAKPKAHTAGTMKQKASDNTGARIKAPAERPAAQLRATVVRRASSSSPAKPKARTVAATKRKARSAR